VAASTLIAPVKDALAGGRSAKAVKGVWKRNTIKIFPAVVVAAVPAAKVDQGGLDGWMKKYNVPFSA